MSALSGVRVLDLSHGIAGPFAARLLGDLGADVIRVENPDGLDPMRFAQPLLADAPEGEASLLFQYLNWNKRSLSLDISRHDSRTTFQQLIQTHDIVLESFNPGFLQSLGLDYAQLRQWNPALVLVSVSPFGQSGPYAGFADSDLVLQAMSGIMQISGRVDLAPLKHGLEQGYFCGGLNAAYAGLAAYFAALEQGVGEHVDLSVHECLVSELVMNQPLYTFAGVVQNRRAVVQDPFAGEPIPVKNGYVSFQTGGGAPIDTLADVFGDERFRDPNYARGVYRVQHADRISAELSETLASYDAREVFLKAADQRLLAGFVQTAENFLSCPQLSARQFLSKLDGLDAEHYVFPRRVIGLSDSPPVALTRAPRLGEHSAEILEELQQSATSPQPPNAVKAPVLPLTGMVVVDLSTVFAVPYLGSLLADLGAEVIKVESPTRVDQSRKPTTGPYLRNAPGDEPWNEAGAFYVLNHGKQSVALDLGQEQGRDVLRDLIRKADILLENFTPRVMRKWGLDRAELKRLNPRLIVLSNTGYGQTGPWANYPTQGTTLECTMGIANYTGYRNDKPWKVGQSYPDFLACWSGLIGVFAALIQRRKTGMGQAIDVSMYEIGVSLVAPAILHFQVTGQELERIGNEDYVHVPSNLYQTVGRDQWIALTVSNDAQWQQLVGLIDDATLQSSLFVTEAGRQQHRQEIDAVIANWASQQDKTQVMTQLQALGIASGPVLNARELMLNEHLRAREFYEVVAHDAPIGDRPLIGRPYRWKNRTTCIPRPAPRYGQHNRDVLMGWLGYDEARVMALYQQGIVHDHPANVYRAEPMPLQSMLGLKIISEVVPDFEDEIRRVYPSCSCEKSPDFAQN